MENPLQLIDYLRNCCLADHSRSQIWNIFHRSLEQRLFLEGQAPFLTGKDDKIPIDPELSEALKSNAFLYRKEKSLLFMAFILGGTHAEAATDDKNFAVPLLMFPAEIMILGGKAWLIPNKSEVSLNRDVLDRLFEDRPEVSTAFHAFFQQIQETASAAGAIDVLVRTISQIVMCKHMESWPQQLGKKPLQNRLAALRKNKEIGLLPASMVALVPKPRHLRGVLNELQDLSRKEQHSLPLKLLLDQIPFAPETVPWSHAARIPAMLSKSQQKLLTSSASNPLSLVIGPPGTGKTFTIAAIAIEHYHRGESVLIASKMDHAVDVVADKIRELADLKGPIVRGGSSTYLKELKAYLERLLHGMLKAGDPKRLAQLEKVVDKYERLIVEREQDIEALAEQEMKWGRALLEGEGSLKKIIYHQYLKFKGLLKKPIWLLFEELENHCRYRIEMAAKLIDVAHDEQLARAFSNHHRTFKHFLHGIRARTGGVQEERFAEINWPVILSAFPIWLVDLHGIHEVLPMERELFDVAIIDEATQCDMASCLPIAQRAKRLVVVGDPNQLRHISFLSQQKQEEFAGKSGLSPQASSRFNYRKKSILDLVKNTQEQNTPMFFLNEHFRSEPAIINFSNRNFYNDALSVMTAKPGMEQRIALEHVRCEGERLAGGENPQEAEAIIGDLTQQLKLPAAPLSIGILSPFRAQVDYITNILVKRIPPAQFRKHRILVGTAHTFQGEERDLMYLSFVLDDNAHPGAFRFLMRPDVFNVSITRARNFQKVFTSFDPAVLDRSSLLASYLIHIDDEARSHAHTLGESKGGDPFAAEVARVLQAKGYALYRDFPLAGILMDLVACKDGRSVGIDLIGYPGEYENFHPIERYHMIGRAGLAMFPLPYSDWHLGRDKVLKAFDEFFMQKGKTKPRRGVP